ncbi:ComEA family DNA-binding protein [Demequina iriomotensis]|uniref:ComEA family DNA-binding protein n=1 Tax=Demequina iriomotensis TaxID=1536641 RepID=UPI000781F0C1|nr:ComEA family DNA-binding protein [Demequina iriomotensis]
MDPSEDVRARWTDGVRRAAVTAYAAGHGAEPPEPRRTRWRLDARTAATAAATVAVLGAVAWWGLREAPVTPLVGEAGASPTAAASMSAPPATPAAPALAVVHVSGAVVEPGLVTVPADGRVVDAIEAAGGLTEGADEASVNLARGIVDGEHLIVLEAGGGASAGAAPAGAATGAPVNLNSADAVALETLPGIGPVLAARIIADREAHGPFLAVDDLSRVSGVGPALIEGLAGLATA